MRLVDHVAATVIGRPSERDGLDAQRLARGTHDERVARALALPANVLHMGMADVAAVAVRGAGVCRGLLAGTDQAQLNALGTLGIARRTRELSVLGPTEPTKILHMQAVVDMPARGRELGREAQPERFDAQRLARGPQCLIGRRSRPVHPADVLDMCLALDRTCGTGNPNPECLDAQRLAGRAYRDLVVLRGLLTHPALVLNVRLGVQHRLRVGLGDDPGHRLGFDLRGETCVARRLGDRILSRSCHLAIGGSGVIDSTGRHGNGLLAEAPLPGIGFRLGLSCRLDLCRGGVFRQHLFHDLRSSAPALDGRSSKGRERRGRERKRARNRTG